MSYFATSYLYHRICHLFFFNDTATTEIYTLSLHDALPICCCSPPESSAGRRRAAAGGSATWADRKSTRLNSSHTVISYAVFCLKKKKNRREKQLTTQRRDQLQETYAGTLGKPGGTRSTNRR